MHSNNIEEHTDLQKELVEFNKFWKTENTKDKITPILEKIEHI